MTTPAAADSYGAVAGVNFIHFPGTPAAARTGADLRPTVGGFYRVRRSFGSFELGIQYSWRRVSWTACDSESCGGRNEMAWSTHDLEFPVMVRPRITSTSRARIDLQLGASPSLVLRKREFSTRYPTAPLESLGSQDFTFFVGLGAQYQFGELWLGIDVRGGVGVVPRYNASDDDDRSHARAEYLLFTVAREPGAT